MALYALGELPSLETVKTWIDTTARHEPKEEHTLIYAELFDLYARLYERLKEEFDIIAAFQRRSG
ncbi:Gluconokinase [Geobacillus sp. WSUCF1]|nr:Gluconokinase [Geobacillus sp. WSUCF1]